MERRLDETSVYTETIDERSSVETTGPGAGSEGTTLSFIGKGAGPSELGFNCFVTVATPARFQPSKKQRTTRTKDGGGRGRRQEAMNENEVGSEWYSAAANHRA